jgi:N-acetyl-anhydromuramyl-L-alanine amidase AmpD
MNLNREYRLPPEEYYQDPHPKRHIYLHHTVSGSWTSVWDWWNTDPQRIGTAFVIDKDGTIYEVFEPGSWAHHLGCKIPGNLLANQESIGIEIISEGQLERINGEFFWFGGRARYKSSTNHFQEIEPWRGARFFDAYEDAQIDAVCELVPRLCAEFSITPELLLPEGHRNDYRPDLLTTTQKGILTHCNVREDKTDVHPGFPWERLEQALNG